MSFPKHTKQSAPAASREVLERTEKAYGFVPNLFAVLAESPAAVTAYEAIGKALGKTDLSPAEQNLVLVAVSVENGCEYCVAAHSTVAKGAKLSDEALEAARSQSTIADPKLEALRRLATSLVKKRGWLSDDEIQAFLDAGYERRHVLDVITLNALKTLSNYTNHIAETPLDEAFAGQRWEAPVAAGQR